MSVEIKFFFFQNKKYNKLVDIFYTNLSETAHGKKRNFINEDDKELFKADSESSYEQFVEISIKDTIKEVIYELDRFKRSNMPIKGYESKIQGLENAKKKLEPFSKEKIRLDIPLHPTQIYYDIFYSLHLVYGMSDENLKIVFENIIYEVLELEQYTVKPTNRLRKYNIHVNGSDEAKKNFLMIMKLIDDFPN